MANADNDRYVFRCFSRPVEGGVEKVCNLNPALQSLFGVEFAQPSVQPITPAPTAGETVTLSEITAPASSIE